MTDQQGSSEAAEMRFTLNGRALALDADQVTSRLVGVPPEPIRQQGVRVGGVTYPVKQAFEVATGISRAEFTSHTARRHLAAFGFESVGEPQPRTLTGEAASGPETPPDPHGWPWEGKVQDLFAVYLRDQGWTVTAMADTASKAPGVDLLAHMGPRRLGAEVKGWPSKGYADPRRATEMKKTQPSTQAGHWFSQALLKAMMLLDSQPDHESLIVLPDYPRYRDLAERTRTGRQACAVHVVLVEPTRGAVSDTWKWPDVDGRAPLVASPVREPLGLGGPEIAVQRRWFAPGKAVFADASPCLSVAVDFFPPGGQSL